MATWHTSSEKRNLYRFSQAMKVVVVVFFFFAVEWYVSGNDNT
jgi:hypothetical protein